MMRSPSINISSRVPTIIERRRPDQSELSAAHHYRRSVGRPGSADHRQGHARHRQRRHGSRIGVVTPKLPYARFSHNSYPGCDYVKRAAGGECVDRQVVGRRRRRRRSGKRGRGQTSSPRRDNPQAGLSTRYFANEIVAEIEEAQADDLARRHRLARIDTQNLPLVGTTLGLFRITDGRSVETVRAALAADAGVRSVQPNFRYRAAGPEIRQRAERGRPGAIRAGQASPAAGAHAGPWQPTSPLP